MDDIIILHHDKNYLHEVRKYAEKYFKDKLGLELKSNYQVFRATSKELILLGIVILAIMCYLENLYPKKLIRRMRNIDNKIKRGGVFTYHDYCSINSYKGWLKWCNGHNLYTKWIRPLEPLCKKYHKEVIKNEIVQKK